MLSEFLDGFGLDLPDPLSCYVEVNTDILEGEPGFPVIHAEAESQYASFFVAEDLSHQRQERLPVRFLRRRFIGCGGFLILQEVTQNRTVFSNFLVPADAVDCFLGQADHFAQGKFCPSGNFLVGGQGLVFLLVAPAEPANFGEGGNHVGGVPDLLGLVLQRPTDELFDPIGCVGGKFRAVGVVALSRLDKTSVALADKIHQGKPHADELVCVFDNKSQIALD